MDVGRDVLAPLSAVSRAVVRAGPGRGAHRGRSAERGDPGPRVGRGGVRLAPAALLPGPVRADPGLDAAARGPGPRPRRRPTRRSSLPQPGQPGPRDPGRGRRGRGRDRGWAAAARVARRRAPTPSCEELRRHGHQREAAIVALQAARVAVRRGMLDDARARIDQVRVTEDSPVATRLLWREVRSELAQARGDRRHARDHVRAGLADLHAWQSSFGSLDLQSTLVGPRSRPGRCRGSGSRSRDGSPDLAYEWSERARALVARVTPVRPPADEQVAADADRAAGAARRRPGAALRRRPAARPAARPDPRAELVRRRGRPGRRARRPRGGARPSWPPPTPAWWRTSRSTAGSPRSS